MLSSGAVASGVGVYWLFYGGADRSAAATLRPGLALSQDGRVGGGTDALPRGVTSTHPHSSSPPHLFHFPPFPPHLNLLIPPSRRRHWARIEGSHHSGAVLDAGAVGSWDAGGIACARLCVAGPRDLRLFYSSHATGGGSSSIGMALSPDGLAWRKAGQPVWIGGGEEWEAGGVTAPHVHRTGPDSWLMFYEAMGADGRSSVGAATSRNGAAWAPAGRVLAPGKDGSWDDGGVGAPCGVPMAGGRWRLYYEGRRNGAELPQGLGLAVSQEGAAAPHAQPFSRRVAKTGA